MEDKTRSVMPRYYYDGFELCRQGANGDVELLNAHVQILETHNLDNGQEQTQRYLLQVTTPAGTYNGLSDPEVFHRDLQVELARICHIPVRVRPNMGPSAVDGILALSDPEMRHIITHTGWRTVNGEPTFILGTGALEREEVDVSFSDLASAERYSLPSSPSTGEVLRGLDVALSLLNCSSRLVTWPILSHMFSAPLRPFMPTRQKAALHLVGTTGSWKTTLASLFLCCWGDFRDGTPTETWASTPNFLGRVGFTLKDLPVVIDDFKPSMTSNRDVTRLIQNYADGTARGRMNADSSLRKSYPFRGVIVSTGEEQIGIESSVVARVLSLRVTKEVVNIDVISKCQQRSAELPALTSAYIAWLRDHRDFIKEIVNATFFKARNLFTIEVQRAGGGHGRVATSAATSVMGGLIFILWLKREGFIDEDQFKSFETEMIFAYKQLITYQVPEIKDQEPSTIFLMHLRALISMGRVRVDSRRVPLTDEQARGMPPLVAFRDGDGDYLHNTAAVNEVQNFLRNEGQRIQFSARAIYKELRAKGLVVPDSKDKTTKVIRVGGKCQRVVHLPPRFLDEQEEV